tara:strand:- start:6494 stop:7450 length:957 start_codon:yes stop_codon:yes gene_type:complete
MAVKFRDYYEVLGVERSASQAEIKSSYRKLARKYHPDVNKGGDAEAKFKEANEAYEVLSDPEKRRKYDQLGANWQHGSEFTPPPGWGGFPGSGGNTQFEYEFGGSTGFSDFFENIFGNRSSDPFGAFGGRPQARQAGPSRGKDIETALLVKLEEVMEGATRQVRLKRGNGEEKVIRVKIPKGVKDGQLIRCAGQGGVGSMGGSSGDLLLRVRLERHPDFHVEGSDLYHELNVAPWECVLGAEILLQTLHGKMKVRIPEGTQSGTSLRVKGRGLPIGESGFGDLYVEINVRLPKISSSKEKELWSKLAKQTKFDPRSDG